MKGLLEALPLPSLEVVLFVWSNEAFSFAVRYVRGSNVTIAQEELPMQSAHGKWCITNPYNRKPSNGHSKGVLKSLMGPGPYWVIVNMSLYVTVQSPLELFTEACVSINNETTKMVSCNTPEYVLLQLRQWRGHLPPSVCWLSNNDDVATDGLPCTPDWWSPLVKGTVVATEMQMILDDSDFDVDFCFMPEIQEPQDSNGGGEEGL
jgi:hypothetical protein